MRPHEANPPPKTQRRGYERPWWQSIPFEDFVTRVHTMTYGELRVLASELAGVTSLMQAQIETKKGSEHREWRQRTRAAIGFVSEKRRIVAAEIGRHEVDRKAEREQRRTAAAADDVKAARELLDNGDLRGAIDRILTVLEKHQ